MTLRKHRPMISAMRMGLLAALVGLTLIGLSVVLHANVVAMTTILAIPLFSGWFGWSESRRGLAWSQTLAFASIVGLAFSCFIFFASHGRPNPFGYVLAILIFVSCAVTAQTAARWRQGDRVIAAAVLLVSLIMILGGWKLLPELYEKLEEHRIASLVDKPLPALAFTDLSGSPIPESAWRGKVTVIDFWGVWCGNCIAEMPQLNAIHAKYKNDPRVQFVSVNSELNGDDLPKINRFLARGLTNLPQALDPSHTCDALGISALPQILVVDPRAHVRFIHSGFDRQGRGQEILSNEIDYLIGPA